MNTPHLLTGGNNPCRCHLYRAEIQRREDINKKTSKSGPILHYLDILTHYNDIYAYISQQMYQMIHGCTRERVSIEGEYCGKIFHTDLSVVLGDLYKMALTWPEVMCRRYSIPLSWRRPPGLPKPVYKRNEGKETKNETIILCTRSYEPVRPPTNRYAQWRPFGGFGGQRNSTSIGRW
jgi:hypothetical protein